MSRPSRRSFAKRSPSTVLASRNLRRKRSPKGFRLKQATYPGNITDFYTYDADGQLVDKNSTVYIGGVYEKDTSTGTITKYYSIAGDRVAMRKGSTMYFLTTDQLGGTGLVTDAYGTLVSRLRYYPYGGIRTQDGLSPPTDKLFTGQQRETEPTPLFRTPRLWRDARPERSPASELFTNGSLSKRLAALLQGAPGKR